MKKIKNITTMITSVFIFLMAASFFLPTQASAKTTLILSHAMPTFHIFHKVSERFIQNVTEKSGGQIKVDYFPGGTLGDWANQVDQTIAGSIQMNITWALSELNPKLDLSIYGGLVDNWPAARQLYGKGGYIDSLYDDMYAKLGLANLGLVPSGFAGYSVRKGKQLPVDVPETSKGFKMRVPPFLMGIDRYKALGFSVVTVPLSELYTALQTGAVDGGAYNPPVDALPFSDVLDAYVHAKLHFEHTFILANAAWLESLPQQEQQWIKESMDEAVSWSWTEIETFNHEVLKEMETKGLSVVELTPKQTQKHLSLIRSAEQPRMEELLGKETVARILKEAEAAMAR